MTIKRMLVLTSAVIGLVVVAPANATAKQWYTSNTTITGEDHFWVHGHVNATIPTFGAELTCDVTANVSLENGGGNARGSVSELVIDAPSENCHGVFQIGSEKITCAITSALGGAGGIHTSGSNVEVTGTSFSDVLQGCPVTEEVGASGTATGLFNNASHCIDFNKNGDLKVFSTFDVFLDGSVCDGTGALELK